MIVITQNVSESFNNENTLRVVKENGGSSAVKHRIMFGSDPENIPTADDDANLHALGMRIANLFGIFIQALDVDAIALFAHQAFAAELEKDSFEFHRIV